MMALPIHIAAWLSQPLEARPLRPAQPPMRGAFFASGLGPLFLSRSGGIKARLAESDSPRTPSMGPANPNKE